MRFIDADKLIEKITQNCPFKIDTNYESVWGIPIIEAIPIEWLKNKSKDLADAYWNKARNKLVLNMNELPLVIDEIVRIWEKENEYKESD